MKLEINNINLLFNNNLVLYRGLVYNEYTYNPFNGTNEIFILKK
jgi:hypothetical protein